MKHVTEKLGLYFTGEERLDGAVHPQQDADQADSAHLQQDQQVHVRLPEHRRRLWHRELPGNQSRFTQIHHFLFVYIRIQSLLIPVTSILQFFSIKLFS